MDFWLERQNERGYYGIWFTDEKPWTSDLCLLIIDQKGVDTHIALTPEAAATLAESLTSARCSGNVHFRDAEIKASNTEEEDVFNLVSVESDSDGITLVTHVFDEGQMPDYYVRLQMDESMVQQTCMVLRQYAEGFGK